MATSKVDTSPSQAHYLPCPSCGSQLRYSAEHKKISCNHCGYKEEVDRSNDEVVEKCLGDAIDQAANYVPEDIGKKVIECQNCGAHFMVDAKKVKIDCGFCGSIKVNTEAYKHQYIEPQGIIPFLVSKAEAEKAFHKWIKQGAFHPNKLKRLAKVDSLHGIYVPFWTYDAQTVTQWSGQAGHYISGVQNMTTRPTNHRRNNDPEQDIRWEHKSGVLSHFFDDVQVVASGGLSQSDMNRVLPFKTEEVVNFDPRLLVDWEAEVYSIGVEKGFHQAEAIMDRKIWHLVHAQIGGVKQRNVQVNTNKSDFTFKHIILPIWICSYEYMNKVYHFTINGQTGRVGGEKPLSYVKIALMIAAFVGFLAMIWLLKAYRVFS